jgi:prepilin-type N-terminal cleavage/methylation domain-containing protein
MNIYSEAGVRRSGFTLIELSIVLVVIGLIVGGVIAGQSLMRSSQLQSIISDQAKYVEAAKQFREKYGFWPGDFPNATTSWGAMTTCPPAAGSSSSGILTCNGNGDSQINFQTNASGTTTNLNEAFLFWQHLTNAQLIEGKYTGIAGSGGNSDHVAGKNCPEGRGKGMGFGITYAGTIVGGNDIYGNSTSYFNYNYGHVLVVGGYSSGNLPVAAALSPAEAQGLDTKYDDGLPATGNVQTWANGSAYNANCSSATAYNITKNGLQCSMILLTGF